MLRRVALAVGILVGCAPAMTYASQPAPWLTLLPTPALPTPDRTALLPFKGVQLWYGEYGARHAGST